VLIQKRSRKKKQQKQSSKGWLQTCKRKLNGISS
jgi:hypothetical protein